MNMSHKSKFSKLYIAIFTILLVLMNSVLTLGNLNIITSPPSGITLTVPSSTTSIPVDVVVDEVFSSMTLLVHYNPSVIKATSVTAGVATGLTTVGNTNIGQTPTTGTLGYANVPAATGLVNAEDLGYVKFEWSEPTGEDLLSGGKIFTINFVPVAPGNTNITIEQVDPGVALFTNFLSEDVFVPVVNLGSITITGLTNIGVLTTAITNATTLLNSKTAGTAVGNVPQAAKTAFQAVIDAATVVKENASATQTEVDAQVAALGTATITFDATVIEAIPVNKALLATAITNATTLIDGKTVGTAVGNVPQTAKDDFQAVITAATAVNGNASATQTQVDAQVTALATATIAFNATVIVVAPVNKVDLDTAITNATTLIGSKTVGTAVGNVPQTGKDDFQAVITAATAVNGNASATQTQVDAQVTALATATIAFNATVIVVAPVNKVALATAITNATTLIGSKTVGTAVGNVPQTAKNAFQAVITAATTVNGNAGATQAEVDAAVTNLSAATTTFNAAVIPAPSATPITLQSDAIDAANKVVTLTFNQNIYNTASIADLKSAITFAADGHSFSALASADIVSISGKTLVIEFATALTGTDNKVRIAANALKDSSNNVLATTIETTVFTFDECFIATAAFGSKNQTDVVLLRQFRDKFLLSNPVGKAFVETYYHYSPPIAQSIAGSGVLKFITRILLLPFVVVVYLLFQPVLLVGLLAGLAFMITQRRRNKVLNVK